MKNTENFNLKQPEPTDFYNVEDFNQNAAVIDGELQKAAVHSGDASRHVTAAEKASWNQQASTGAAALNAHKADTTAHAGIAERVHSLTHLKTGSVHALMGLSGKAGLLSAKFKATAAFALNDTFTVDGIAYTAKLTNGKALPKDNFVANVLTDCIIDTAGKTINFKAGGVDVSAATAVESDVLSGKKFFSGTDTLRTGTLSTASLVSAIGSPAVTSDTLSQLASRINTAKSTMATAITGKGVSTSASASLAQMAANIGSIQPLKSYSGSFYFEGGGSITVPLTNCFAVSGTVAVQSGWNRWECGFCNGRGGRTSGTGTGGMYDWGSISCSGSTVSAGSGNGGTIGCSFVVYGY